MRGCPIPVREAIGPTSAVKTPDPTLPIDQRGPEGDAREAPFLVVVQGRRPGERVSLNRERTTIGRAQECDLRLDSRVVSAEHARVMRSDEGFEIEDLGSTNGVTINGRRLGENELHPLGHGDAITISDHVLLFVDRGSFTDSRGLSTIHIDSDRARREADALLAELGIPRRGDAGA